LAGGRIDCASDLGPGGVGRTSRGAAGVNQMWTKRARADLRLRVNRDWAPQHSLAAVMIGPRILILIFPELRHREHVLSSHLNPSTLIGWAITVEPQDFRTTQILRRRVIC
jgi:hypothetical protein